MEAPPYSLCNPMKKTTVINRSYAILQSIAITSMIFYRLSSFHHSTPSFPLLLVFASELILSFLWLLGQAYLWRPCTRKTFPERLMLREKTAEQLPGIDVFVCTADPEKEPPLEVMNTVLSAMAMDYPTEKLSVYVSDDGGCALTLYAMREAREFGRYWLPFCRRFGIKTRCPKLYFSRYDDDFAGRGYEEEKENIKLKYKLLEEHVKKAESSGEILRGINSKNHPPHVEVIQDESDNSTGSNVEKMPRLVYICREKTASAPHHFKAGALNVVLRVSSMISNAPYVLVLDCDMRCNDPSSAKQAMCFHLDPNISPNLAFVQFPQMFHNLSNMDIYDGKLRSVFSVKWPGMDGLQGPMLSGTGFYIKRKALYGDIVREDTDFTLLKQYLGPSNELVKSLNSSNNNNNTDITSRLLEETRLLASCKYENESQWGKQVGFLYNSVIEDYLTGFTLHSKGWKSIFYNPPRAAFLGTATTKLNDTLLQGARWNSGALQVTFSRLCPLVYRLTSRMSVLQRMCYVYLSFQPLYFFPIWCLATVPQLCLLHAIPLYPKASSLWFMVFSYIFTMSQLKHAEEVLSTGDPIRTWWDEQRIWTMKAIISYTIGTMNVVLKCFGLKEANFVPTNKVADDEQTMFYQKGLFNFQASTIVLVPLVTLITLNIFCFIAGTVRTIIDGSFDAMFGQVFISFYVLSVHYPLIDGMVFRKDKGRVPTSVTISSVAISVSVLYFGSLIHMS
ncbi:cellulose synthase like G2, ARABIDOPSIS THALIANA CELLULOSE SYNTHASE LIKE G2 [Hibiscus trionum]|uniref:Cellulose synthase like G2, ARABIDOPSIS THALIANA CELLULOSE SYNTHASE LIKE G2 n=2 Tax=Hibiscus trionum TaxID=183268 RepID=A0A9W7MLL4_HIBTR|nr:cellulose synthase like G2, ARABIDOPSIS THALIANA CELLULOSE SYNTHASE LIKE G2 [Hibiscus trionum]